MVLPIQQKYCTFMTLEVVSQSDRHGRINKVTPGVLVRIKLRKKVNLLSRHSAAAGWGGGGYINIDTVTGIGRIGLGNTGIDLTS